jgi:hypothetical protein
MTILPSSFAALALLAHLVLAPPTTTPGSNAGGSHGPLPRPPADHGDTPLLASLARPDARLTDLHVFTRGDDLVICVCSNPAVPPGLTSYLWSSDVQFEVHIDNTDHAQVEFGDPGDLAEFGGTITRPARIEDRIVLRVRGDAAGVAQLSASGLAGPLIQREARFFAGLRDDPFIRGPRIGRNVAAFVIELPLRRIVRGHKPVLVWATAAIDGRPEPFQEMAGRALRSMFASSDFMNTSTPSEHFTLFNSVPDVLIFDPTRPASYPNGRELVDDVVDLVGEPTILAGDAPFPSANDVPFLAHFPYLAPPQ